MLPQEKREIFYTGVSERAGGYEQQRTDRETTLFLLAGSVKHLRGIGDFSKVALKQALIG